MKKVYSLIDRHQGVIIASSKTRRILEEILMDIFFEAYRAEMQDAADCHWINPIEPTDDCRCYAQDVWNSLMAWNKSVYDIQRSELV